MNETNHSLNYEIEQCFKVGMDKSYIKKLKKLEMSAEQFKIIRLCFLGGFKQNELNIYLTHLLSAEQMLALYEAKQLGYHYQYLKEMSESNLNASEMRLKTIFYKKWEQENKNNYHI